MFFSASGRPIRSAVRFIEGLASLGTFISLGFDASDECERSWTIFVQNGVQKVYKMFQDTVPDATAKTC